MSHDSFVTSSRAALAARRGARWFLIAAAVFPIALTSRPAVARDDIVVTFEADGVAEMVINDFPISATITQGMVSLQTDEVTCVASPAHPCHYILNVLRTTLSTFVFDDVTISDSVAIINGPLAVVDSGEGLVIPPGTPVVTALTLDGERHTVDSTTPTGIVVMLDVADREATVLGSFVGSLEDVSVEATIIANGQRPFLNLPPIASAGADHTVSCGASAHLDGSATTDPDGNLFLLSWTENGVSLGFGPNLDVSLAPGIHNILLEAFDTFEGRGVDTVTVSVIFDTTPPVFTSVPTRIAIRSCAAPSIGIATAVDDCGAATVTSNAPAVFPLGLTVVTWTAIDAAGNRATATQEVFAELGDDASCCPAGSHVIIGTSASELITGTPGSDCILGLGGSDILLGGDGSDFLSGGSGNDQLIGDRDGAPSQPAFADYLAGGEGNDILLGSDGDDEMFGDAGNDILTGVGGNDQLSGGDGNDVCVAGNGDSRLLGGPGDDQLVVGNGASVLSGDDGNDRLVGVIGRHSLNGGAGVDLCLASLQSTKTLCER